MIADILIAALVVGATGLVIGLLLGFAADRFHVEVDEREAAIREVLPGNNCGGCGYAGCDGLAKAIAEGRAPANACPVGAEPVAKQIAAIMGTEAESGGRMTAFVACAGACDKANTKYEYYGMQDCRAAAIVPGGGEKACASGCLGLGSCVRACPFDAIHIQNGIAKVDEEKCKACKKCIAVCPKQIIRLVPAASESRVQCSNTLKGMPVKKQCSVGCLGCGLCARNCPNKAIAMKDNLPVFDYQLCTNCGLCAQKCPVHIITARENAQN